MENNTDANTVSYAKDVRPLFTDIDLDHMSFMFDLGSYDDVKSNASDIYGAVSGGTMPPAPEGPWTPDKVRTFKAWIDGGCQP